MKYPLRHVVLPDVAHEYVSIQPDHLAAAPRLAMTAFISLIETVLRGLPNMAFNAVTDRVAAMNS